MPARTQEDFARYNEGLKKIVQELRQQNVTDGEAVAKRIAQYRRDFLQDPYNVLDLD